jgi:hypothetical protein
MRFTKIMWGYDIWKSVSKVCDKIEYGHVLNKTHKQRCEERYKADKEATNISPILY